MNNKKKNVALLISSGFLFLALLDGWEYDFFTILRFVVFISTAYVAWMAYEENRIAWSYLLGSISILYNPFFPIHLDRDNWVLIDVIVGSTLLITAHTLILNATEQNSYINKDLVKVIGVALLSSLFLYSLGGGGDLKPWIFFFYFIVFLYLGADYIRNEITNSNAFINKNFSWLIGVSMILVCVNIATIITLEAFVDYCNGFFKNEMLCEIEKAESRISDKYESGDYSEHEWGLR